MSRHGFRNFFEKTLLVVFVLSFGLLIFQLGRRYGRFFDLHQAEELSISPTLQARLKSLEEPLQVYIFYQNISPEIKSIRQFLNRYQCIASNQFHVTFVDIIRQPRVAQELEQRFGLIKQEQIIVTYHNQQRVLPLEEGINNHQQIIETLTNLLCGLSKKILFSTGHGELDPESVHPYFGGSEWKRTLKEKGYQVQKIHLSDEFEDALLIIAAPKCNFSESEIGILQKLLQNRTSVLLLLSPPYICGLESFLRQYGLSIEGTIDSSNLAQKRLSSNGELLVNGFGNYPRMQAFEGQSVIFSHSFLLQENSNSMQHHSVLALPNDQLLNGPIAENNKNIGILLDVSSSSKGKLLVVGSVDFVENRRFNDLGNPNFAGALVDVLSEKIENPLSRSVVRDYKLTLSNLDLKRILMGFVVLIFSVFCTAWIVRPQKKRR